MGLKEEMTRKEFLVLTFTLIGSTAAIGNCDDDDDNNTTGLGGRGGTTGTGGSGGGGGTGATSCSDPLRATQVSDTTGHSHSVIIPASALNASSAQTFSTSVTLGHMHTVTLDPAQLSTLKSGGGVNVMSSISDSHAHMYSISCN